MASAGDGSEMGDGSQAATFGQLGQLFEAWDSVQRLRDRMRNVGRLVVELPPQDKAEQPSDSPVAKTMANLRHNHQAMLPLTKAMSQAPDKVPCIAKLREELVKFYEAHGKNPSFKAVQDEAWSLRYLYGLVKQLTYKPKAPTDARWNLYWIFFSWYPNHFIFHLDQYMYGLNFSLL